MDARRGSLGLQSRVSPPHTPKSPSGGAAGIAGTGVDGTGADGTGSPGSRFHFRQYQYSGALGSSGGTFSRTRISSQAHPVEETLEVQTAAALDNIPVEAQAQDLNEKAAAQFRAAREKVEDWIETHVQCNYKVRNEQSVNIINIIFIYYTAVLPVTYPFQFYFRFFFILSFSLHSPQSAPCLS